MFPPLRQPTEPTRRKLHITQLPCSKPRLRALATHIGKFIGSAQDLGGTFRDDDLGTRHDTRVVGGLDDHRLVLGNSTDRVVLKWHRLCGSRVDVQRFALPIADQGKALLRRSLSKRLVKRCKRRGMSLRQFQIDGIVKRQAVSLGQREGDVQIGLHIGADEQIGQGVQAVHGAAGAELFTPGRNEKAVAHFQVPQMRHKPLIAFQTP